MFFLAKIEDPPAAADYPPNSDDPVAAAFFTPNSPLAC